MVAAVPADFESLSLSPSLLAVVAELGYDEPMPIQVECIPLLLAGRDVIGQSKTGSGKTAAFSLPILQNLDVDRRELQALIVCPTRELSAQVARELRKLGRRHQGLQVLEVCGGQPIRAQTSALERGVHVAVGTPGRLLDHLRRGTMELRSVVTAVVDEADRMLDMGFLADMEAILDSLPSSRQTALFSATFPTSIEQMSQTHQRDAVRVIVGEPEQVTQIRQLSLLVDKEHKLHALYWVLDQYPHESALVFCNFKATVADLVHALATLGASVDCLHGDLDQFHRDQVLARFRNGSVRILVATDVAGRGLDVEDLDLVINYELPQQPEIYVHRIGRTGRAGKRGISVSLATAGDDKRLAAIDGLTGTPIERLPRIRRDAAGVDELAETFTRDAEMDTVLISGGRKDKVRPGDILGALTGEAGGLRGADIGKIELHDRLSYVAVSKRVSRHAVKSLNKGRIKAKRFRATLVKRSRT
jgi:ATP-independent RNA helicase DbpA